MTVPVTTGLVLHVDATQITGLVNNDPVAQWDDLSGQNSHATQTTETSKPLYKTNTINGKPAVWFDGTNDHLIVGQPANLNFIGTDDFIIFCAVQTTLPGTFIGKAHSTDAERQWQIYAQYNELRGLVGGTHLYPDPVYPVEDGNPHVIGLPNYDNAGVREFRLRFDGGQSQVQTPGTATTRTIDVLIGARRAYADNTGLGYLLTGNIGEILVYNRTLTTAEVADVEGYLSSKWLAPDGSAFKPWLIETKADLQNIGAGDANWANWATRKDDDGVDTTKYNTWTMAHYYKLMNDINLGAGSFTPIGFGTSTNYTAFDGQLDGQNYKIHNGSISKGSTDQYIGLFAYLAAAGVLKNIKPQITTTGYIRVGMLVGQSYGTVDNCHGEGAVYGTYVSTGDSGFTGGMIGYGYGYTKNSSFIGSVDVDSLACGGFAGHLTAANTTENCFAEVTVTGAGEDIGAFAGRCNGGHLVKNCYATGSVACRRWAGGFISWAYDAGTNMDNCYCVTTLSQTDSGTLSGFCLADLSATVTDSFYDTEAGYPTSQSGTGKTTAQMKDIATYTGWDIVTKANWVDETWYIDTASYPELGWEYVVPELTLTASQVGNDIYLSWV